MAKYRKKPDKMTPWEKELERIKIEVAEELGLGAKISEVGWENLTARETGKIGGRMSRLLRKDETNGQEGPPRAK